MFFIGGTVTRGCGFAHIVPFTCCFWHSAVLIYLRSLTQSRIHRVQFAPVLGSPVGSQLLCNHQGLLLVPWAVVSVYHTLAVERLLLGVAVFWSNFIVTQITLLLSQCCLFTGLCCLTLSFYLAVSGHCAALGIALLFVPLLVLTFLNVHFCPKSFFFGTLAMLNMFLCAPPLQLYLWEVYFK